MFDGVQQVSVKGLLCKDGKVLVLLSPKRGYWELPGGRMDFGETAEQAFQREMEEELGFKKVNLEKFINIWSFTSVRDEVKYHFIVLDFAVSTDESDIRLSEEHTEYKWVSAEEASGLKMREGHKKSIKKFFKGK